MKKVFMFTVLLFIRVSMVFAAAFSPTVLKLSASPYIQYNFDGKNLEIPVAVTGTPALAYLLVFTKDNGSTISKVRNGYLGWHYVNKIDTCLYLSPMNQLQQGTNRIIWNGKDENGKAVPKGDYTYYLFGYDNANMRVQMTKYMDLQAHGHPLIVTQDTAGKPLAKPIIYDAVQNRSQETTASVTLSKKWFVGSDPSDQSLLETTSCMGWNSIGGGGLAFTNDFKYYFYGSLKAINSRIIQKWEWVPNGASNFQDSWGENGQFTFTTAQKMGWSHDASTVSDGKGTLFSVNGDVSGAGTESELIYIDINDGTEIKRLDMGDWFVSIADGEAGGQSSSGPISWVLKHDRFAMGAHTTCAQTMVDPYYESEEDATLWANMNGDYTGDHNFEPDSGRPWICNDYYVAPYKYNVAADDNLFVAFPSFDLGAVSFGLFAPDGTGMSYQVLAGETANQKYGIQFIDYGSPYDGIYTSNNSGDALDITWWYVGHDSIRGVISSQVSVEETPSAFAVTQNSPNPFNPATTISFAIPEAGTVSVDVFNVAGQKVDTIASEFMSAGSHSVTWDATKFSTGVYFYTVKAGEFSKTMKMTLVK